MVAGLIYDIHKASHKTNKNKNIVVPLPSYTVSFVISTDVNIVSSMQRLLIKPVIII